MTRLRAAALFLFAIVAVACGPVPAAAAPDVTIVGEHPNGTPGGHVYELRVAPGARDAIAIVPPEARSATLVVDGVARRRTGGAVLAASGPLGHAAPVLPLDAAAPGARVAIVIVGSAAPPAFAEPGVARTAHDVGFASGAYYATLVTLALFQLVALLALRDPCIAWYLAFTLSLVGLEISRDGLLPPRLGVPAHEVFRVSFMFALLGFSASYLRLRTEAPRLLALAIAGVAAPTAITAAAITLAQRGESIALLAAADLTGMLSLLVVAGARRRQGYVPATYLGLGLLGLPLAFAAETALTISGIHSPLVDYWGLEIGSVCDVVLFSLAFVLRSRYVAREHERVRRDLDVATYAATHDELTGLANRRGLEAALERSSDAASTVLFIDLDDFKAINDRGGHAAGDETLRAVARILRRSVRATDVVARLGGDEFVIVLAGEAERDRAATVVRRITDGVAAIVPLPEAKSFRIGVSIGVADVAVGASFAETLARADADAYRIKSQHHEAARTNRFGRAREAS